MRTEIAGLLVLVALTACGAGTTPSASGMVTASEVPRSQQGVVDVTVEERGGMCAAPDGTGTVCARTVTVTSDGTVTVADVTTTSPEPVEQVEPGVALALAEIIEKGFDDLAAVKFEGTCPTAVDGVERTITVRRLPGGPQAAMADAAVIAIGSCQHDLTTPKARAVLDRFDDVWDGADLPRP